MSRPLLAAGEILFDHCYPLYRRLYAAYKAVADRDERTALRRRIRPGMTIADVGANIGVYTRWFARLVGEGGHVHAFEPSPVNYARLRDHVGACRNVTAVHAAAGDATGTIGLFISEDYNVDHRTFDNGAGRRRIDVPVVRLDDYFDRGSRVDLIKIDVQGDEYRVLQGATRVLAENHAITLFIEFWPLGLSQAQVDPATLLDFLSARGFAFTQMGGTAAYQDPASGAAPARRHDEYWHLLAGRNG